MCCNVVAKLQHFCNMCKFLVYKNNLFSAFYNLNGISATGCGEEFEF